jgi:hypothetical protein
METQPEGNDPTPAAEAHTSGSPNPEAQGRPRDGAISAKAGFILFAVVGLLLGVVVARPGSLIGKPIQFDLQTDNYVGTHNFQVKIEGIDVVNTEIVTVSGLSTRTRLGKPLECSPIVVERVYKGVDDFYGWRLEVENGNIQPREVTITMMNSAFRPVRAMVLEEAWPSAWQMPDMDASRSGPATERITLTVKRARETAAN